MIVISFILAYTQGEVPRRMRSPPLPECGCSPWRAAVDTGRAQPKIYTLSQNVEAQVGQQEAVA